MSGFFLTLKTRLYETLIQAQSITFLETGVMAQGTLVVNTESLDSSKRQYQINN